MSQWMSGSARKAHRVYWGAGSTSPYKYKLYAYSNDRLVKHSTVVYGTVNPKNGG